MDFSITLQISDDDNNNIKVAQQRVTLAKPVNGEDPNMVWLSIDPFPGMGISWNEEYGIYASTAAIKHGAKISKLSETKPFPAQDGATYTLTANNTFNSSPISDGSVPAGTFAAQNNVPHSAHPLLTFGLTQVPFINQDPQAPKALSASPVLATESIAMTPFTIVYVWLQSEFESETMITKVTGNVAKIRLGGGTNNVSLKFDPNQGKFLPASDSSANVELLVLAA